MAKPKTDEIIQEDNILDDELIEGAEKGALDETVEKPVDTFIDINMRNSEILRAERTDNELEYLRNENAKLKSQLKKLQQSIQGG